MTGPGNRHCASCIGTLSFPKRQMFSEICSAKLCRISAGYVTASHNTDIARILLNDTEVCSTAFSSKCEQCHVVS